MNRTALDLQCMQSIEYPCCVTQARISVVPYWVRSGPFSDLEKKVFVSRRLDTSGWSLFEIRQLVTFCVSLKTW